LIPKAGTGGGAVQRDVLIKAIEATFTTHVITVIRELLDGCLDLTPGSADQPASVFRPAASKAFDRQVLLVSLLTALAIAIALTMARSTGLCSLLNFYPTHESTSIASSVKVAAATN
jgi:hypothetical protein